MNRPTRQQIETAVKAKGYKWFENGDYNLNIVGVRNGETGTEVTNKFDDFLTLSYKEIENGIIIVLTPPQTQENIGLKTL